MRRFILKLGVGLLIFGFILIRVDVEKVLGTLVQMRLSAVVVVNLTTLGGFLLSAVSVIILGQRINPQMSWRYSMRGFLTCTSLSLFIPGRAGDLALPFFWQDFLKHGQSLAVLFIDKTITVFWIFLLGTLGLWMVFRSPAGMVVALVGLAATFGLIALIAVPKTRQVVFQKMPSRIFRFLEGSMNAFRLLLLEGRINILANVCITAARMVVSGVGFWASLWGLDTTIPLFKAILIMAIVQFTTLIPISVMGLGTVEAVCLLALSRLGVEASTTVAALIAGRIITLVWLSSFFFCLAPGYGIVTSAKKRGK